MIRFAAVNHHKILAPARLFTLACCVLMSTLAACNSAPSDQTVHDISAKPATPADRVAEQRTVLPAGQPAESQATFDTPDDAVKALLAACQSSDHAEMKKLFGPAGKDFMTGDPVEDAKDFSDFADEVMDHAALQEKDDHTNILRIGKSEWAYPIPIAKTKDGKWYFDTVAGETEILARRIGGNELEAIGVCHTYVDAQREYGSQDHDGAGVLKYAQRLKSSPGKKDGLYWSAEGAAPTPAASPSAAPQPAPTGASPFGPLIAQAAVEGYAPISGSKNNPSAYHGYYFHILTSQGPAAPGGAYSYVINGNMIAGFALVAYPSEYGKSGIMTFIVSHQGKVYQKDLGPSTTAAAKSMKTYNPDPSWTLVQD